MSSLGIPNRSTVVSIWVNDGVLNAHATISGDNAVRVFKMANSSATDDTVQHCVNTQVRINVLYYDY